MNYNWKEAVRRAKFSNAGSSSQLVDFLPITFWLQEGRWMFQDENRMVTDIKVWQDIPVDTIHFKEIGGAMYATMNPRGEAVVRALTKSIMRGDVKIIGEHSCVNNLGHRPVQGCKEIRATVPVPIKIPQGQEIYANVKPVKVYRESQSWTIYTAFVEESTGSGGERQKMGTSRIYMCGGSTRTVTRTNCRTLVYPFGGMVELLELADTEEKRRTDGRDQFAKVFSPEA